MSLSAVLPAAAPSPTPSESDPVVPTLQDAQESATNAAGWVEENWSDLAGDRAADPADPGDRGGAAVGGAAGHHQADRPDEPHRARRSTAPRSAGCWSTPSGAGSAREAIGSVLRSVASFLILGTAALMILGTFEINLAPLLASAGVAGVAIGFGARNLVTDFLSGVFMILEDQYGVGDTIDAGVASGEVIEVGPAGDQAARRQRRDLVRPQRRGQADRQPQPGLGDRRRGRHGRASTRTWTGSARSSSEVAETTGQGGAVERAPVGPGGGAGPGRGAAGLDGGAGLGEDDAGQGARPWSGSCAGGSSAPSTRRASASWAAPPAPRGRLRPPTRRPGWPPRPRYANPASPQSTARVPAAGRRTSRSNRRRAARAAPGLTGCRPFPCRPLDAPFAPGLRSSAIRQETFLTVTAGLGGTPDGRPAPAAEKLGQSR